MSVIPALYTDGRIVTGVHHGEAFGKLSEREKTSQIISGFIDPETKKFFSEEKEFYLKKIIFMRHADVDISEGNPGITEAGRTQAERAARFVFSNINEIREYIGFCSPTKRCIETSECISHVTHVEFSINEEFLDQKEEESVDKFAHRIAETLKTIPDKCFIISHCNLIFNMIKLASQDTVVEKIPKGSITYLNGPKTIWISKQIEA